MISSVDDTEYSGLSKSEKYHYVKTALLGLHAGESDSIANLANTTAVLKEVFNWFWVGFYIVKNEELVLGPFQGTVACTRIAFGKGVCGKCWERKEPMLVPDVNQFPGHIACSALSQSEIVIPVIKNGLVVAVLDIDSIVLNDFDEDDLQGLLDVVEVMTPHLLFNSL